MVTNNPEKAVEYFEAKLQFTTGPVELNHMIEENENINIIDVRAGDDYLKGHVPGAYNLPREQWETLAGLEKEKTNIVYCYSHVCHLAAAAARFFAAHGYPVMELDGGFDEWLKMGLPVKTKAKQPV